MSGAFPSRHIVTAGAYCCSLIRTLMPTFSSIEAIRKADNSIDPKERIRLYSTAQKRIAAQAYWVPLWTFSLTTAQSKSLDFSMDVDEFARFYRASWR